MAVNRPASYIEQATGDHRLRPLLFGRLNRQIRLTSAVIGALGCLAIGMVSYSLTTGAMAATKPASEEGSQGRQVSLAEQLRVGLKAKTSKDKQFIQTVVKLVDQGKLPRKIVDTTFLWARQRAERRSKKRQLRPMVYFWPALHIRAKKVGVLLPKAPWQPVIL